MRRARHALALGLWPAAVVAMLLCAPSLAEARRVRPLFEPTDLELEDPGVLELDLEFGAVRSQGPWRVVVPDFELDVGLLRNLEFDIDGAYAIEGPSAGPFAFDHAAPDSLWPAAKVGLYDAHDEDTHGAFALGVQLGPKLPVARASHGVGFEALALIGTSYARTHLVWNAGGFADPAVDATPTRPTGIELGVNADVDLDASDTFSLTLGLSSVYFLSRDPHQLLATGGVTWSAFSSLDLSLVALAGLLDGSDRYGVLVGVSPKLRLFR